MGRILKQVAAFLMIVMLVFSFAQAENDSIKSYTLTKETDRVKTKHDNGFIKVENLDKNDSHFGWGLGEFYIQGYSDMTMETDGTPVFLLKEDDEIILGFRISQDINALNGNAALRINEDSNGFDTAFEVKDMNFGRGCLILQKTDSDGHVNEPVVMPDFLAKASENSAETLIGPLTEGSYKGQLDYEMQFPGALGIAGYSDYKIPFTFKVKANKEYYETVAASTSINSNGVQTGTIIVAVCGVLVVIMFAISLFIRKRKPSSGDNDPGSASTGIPAGAAEYIPSDSNETAWPIRGSQTSNVISSDKVGEAYINGTEMKEPRISQRIRTIAILLMVALLCIFGLKPVLANPETYSDSITFLEERLANTNKLVLGSGSASFVISLFPDDTGTPIANELAKVSSYLLLVISAILLEKYLITAIGLVTSLIIFPASCFFGIISSMTHGIYKKKMAEYAIRLAIFGICIILIIPIGCACGRTIEELNKDSINRAMANAEEANNIVEQIPDTEEKDIFQRIGEFFGNIWNSAVQAYEWGKTVLSNYMSSVAVMLVTSIAIPIIMMLAFIWMIKFLTKKDFTNMILGMTGRFVDKTSKRIVGQRKYESDETL